MTAGDIEVIKCSNRQEAIIRFNCIADEITGVIEGKD